MTNNELRELCNRVMSIEAGRRAIRLSPYEPYKFIYEDRASEMSYIQFNNGSRLDVGLDRPAIAWTPVHMSGNLTTNTPSCRDKTIMTDIDDMLTGL